MTKLIQYISTNGDVEIGIVTDLKFIRSLTEKHTMLTLATQAMEKETPIETLALSLASDAQLNYQDLLDNNRVLAPIHHPDPAHLMVSGTGLTHLGSADTRAAMHAKPDQLTDSMKMFQMGIKGGKPIKGEVGVQPEWFYKGDGDCIVAPESNLVSPDFALDGSEEPEIAGIYIISKNRIPCRIGFCLGNEFSDHETEQQNYLYLAHSKLRPCALGPELLLGELPKSILGNSRLLRYESDQKISGNEPTVIWEKQFLSGEDNMSHTISNLETHHFKYKNFLRPGDIHVHFFGTATLSYGDGIRTQSGDIFEIQSDIFGRPLRNTLVLPSQSTVTPSVKSL
ncbi:MAG: FAH family protein [Alphaproteobacteria bacterium]|nr:MAG: FAH family protein [Alphaproteobacteria bacterium]